MFGIGTTEIMVILVVALIVLGPESLPKIARTVGKAMGEFRRVSTEFQRTLNTEIAFEEHSQRKKEAEEELFGENGKNKSANASTVPPIKKAESTSEVTEQTAGVAEQRSETPEQASENTVQTSVASPQANADTSTNVLNTDTEADVAIKPVEKESA